MLLRRGFHPSIAELISRSIRPPWMWSACSSSWIGTRSACSSAARSPGRWALRPPRPAASSRPRRPPRRPTPWSGPASPPGSPTAATDLPALPRASAERSEWYVAQALRRRLRLDAAAGVKFPRLRRGRRPGRPRRGRGEAHRRSAQVPSPPKHLKEPELDAFVARLPRGAPAGYCGVRGGYGVRLFGDKVIPMLLPLDAEVIAGVGQQGGLKNCCHKRLTATPGCWGAISQRARSKRVAASCPP